MGWAFFIWSCPTRGFELPAGKYFSIYWMRPKITARVKLNSSGGAALLSASCMLIRSLPGSESARLSKELRSSGKEGG